MITNKVFTAVADEPMDLCSAKLLQMPEYRPPRTFRGGILRKNDTTYLILQAGKVVIFGTPDLETFTNETMIVLHEAKFINNYWEAESHSKINLYDKKLLDHPEYVRPSQFTGGILKLPGGTFLLFQSGKVVINGIKDEPDLLEFALKTDIYLSDVTLSHCSAFTKVEPLNLQELQRRVPNSIFEPDLHPGLVFRINQASVIVQRKGTVLICGCPSEEEVKSIVKRVVNLINT